MTLEHFLLAAEQASPGPWWADGAVRVQSKAYDVCRVDPVPPHILNHLVVRHFNALLLSRAYMLPRLVRLLLSVRVYVEGSPLSAEIDAAMAELVKEHA
jgi:hypothetical protein